FVSPNYLGDESCCRDLQRVLAASGKPIVPVVLSDILEGRQDLQGLEKAELFRFTPSRGAARSFEECTGPQRKQFANTLFDEIERRLDSIFKPHLTERGLAQSTWKRRLFSDEEAREL